MADDPWAEFRAGPGTGEMVVGPRPPGAPDTVVRPAGAADEERFGTDVAAAGLEAADTAMLGNLPRAMAGYKVATGAQGNYTQALDESLRTLAASREKSPFASTAGGLAGGVPLGMALGPARGATWFGRLLNMGGKGAGLGAAEAAGHTYSGVPEDYFGNAALGSVAGGVVGVGAPIVGGSIARGARALGARGSSVPDVLARAAEADRPAIEAMATRAGSHPSGVPYREMLTEPRTLQNQAAGAVLDPTTEGQNLLIQALRARHESVPEHVTGQTRAILGPVVVPSTEQAALEGQMKALGPYYEHVLNGPNVRAADTAPIANWLDTVAINDRGARQAAAQRVRGMLDITGNRGVLDPHPRTLQATRSDIKNTLRNAEGTLSNDERELLQEADRRMTAELRDKVPGINHVDDYYAELATQHRALGTKSVGTRMFDTGREGVVHPDELRAALAEASRPKGTAGPTQERARLEQAARYEIERRLRTNPNDLSALRKTLGLPNDWNTEKTQIMFGPQRTQRMLDMVDRERAGEESFNKILEGSQTAPRLAAAKGQEGFSSPTLYGRVETIAKNLYDQAQLAATRRSRDDISRILAARDPASVQANAALMLNTSASRNASEAARANILQRILMSGAGVIPKNLVPEQ